jgi:hypothetical protein
MLIYCRYKSIVDEANQQLVHHNEIVLGDQLSRYGIKIPRF